MSTRLTFLLCLVPSVAQAERFTAWEQDGTIWAREEATGDEWQISRGANCHSPYVDGPLAIWIADWSFAADVMMARLTQDHSPGQSFVDWAVHVGPETASDPKVSYIGTTVGDRAYAAWKMNGGLWAERWWDHAPPPVEVVPNYDGPYTLEGHTLSWDGGSMELWFPTPEVPEPGTLAILSIGALALLAYAWRRRREGSGG